MPHDIKRFFRVIADYQAAYPEPWAMQSGDRLTIGHKDNEWSGWLWCTDAKGNSRWVPGAYVSKSGDAGLALCDYDATELTVKVGEILIGDREESDWVWCKNQSGLSGWVPAQNLVREMD